MTTIKEIINDAFDDLEIKSAEVDLTDSELAIGIRRLNRMMVSLAATGMDFGFTKAVTVDDEFTAPDWFEDMAITSLAIRLASGFGVPVTEALAINARIAAKIVFLRISEMSAPSFPNTLPLGAGNYQGDNTKFFRGDVDTLLHTATNVVLSDDEGIQLDTE